MGFALRLARFCRNPLGSKFGFQLLSLSFLFFFITSFRPPQLLFYGEIFEENDFKTFSVFNYVEPGFLHNNVGVNTAGLREVLVEDAEGNLAKIIQPHKREETVRYVAKSGDTITKIAHKFGLKVSTLLWANNLTVKEDVHVGQRLKVPPVDGVFYKIQAEDTLNEIVIAHKSDAEQVLTFNDISNTARLEVGKELFIPGAQKKFIPQKQVVSLPSSGYGGNIESLGFELRRPTKGVLTQGFHRGHYALDIANKLNSPIYASADGVVIKADLGWNYGFGNYVIIDHGNGVETLYAHNSKLMVQTGDMVKTGELIALMGNTGNVWGPTGIHLHFELHIRGRKVNPANYF